MKILSVIIGLFLVLAMVPMVLSANEDGKIIRGGKLLITDVDSKVDGKTDNNLDFGDTIRREALPGSSVEFKITFYNNFTDDLRIENIDVTVTIQEIDDGDDLDQDAKEFDLRPGRDDTITFKFDIPLEVDEDNFNVLVTAEGEDENGTMHEVEYEFELEIKKEDNELRFLSNAITPSEIKCGRTIQLSTAVINTGSRDEEGVALEIVNTELGVSFRETFDLSNSPFDDDSKFRKTYTFVVPKEVSAGVYTIQSKLTYDDATKTETKTADLVVAQCEIVAEPVKEEPKEVKKEEVVVVQTPIDTTPSNVITAGTVTAPTLPATEETSLFGTSGFLIALIVGEVLLLIIAILIIVAIVKRKGE